MVADGRVRQCRPAGAVDGSHVGTCGVANRVGTRWLASTVGLWYPVARSEHHSRVDTGNTHSSCSEFGVTPSMRSHQGAVVQIEVVMSAVCTSRACVELANEGCTGQRYKRSRPHHVPAAPRPPPSGHSPLRGAGASPAINATLFRSGSRLMMRGMRACGQQPSAIVTWARAGCNWSDMPSRALEFAYQGNSRLHERFAGARPHAVRRPRLLSRVRRPLSG